MTYIGGSFLRAGFWVGGFLKEIAAELLDLECCKTAISWAIHWEESSKFLGKQNNTKEDMVLLSSVANRIPDNLIEDQRLRPTHVQAQDISECLHLTIILSPSLPYFPSAHLHFLPHHRGTHKGAESLCRISIATGSPYKNTCIVAGTAVMPIRAMFAKRSSCASLVIAPMFKQKPLLELRDLFPQESL